MASRSERTRSGVLWKKIIPRAGMEQYGPAFYREHSEGSLRSARVVVPLVLKMVAPKSVVDVGCGRGAWLRVFREYGIERILGLDGPYIDPSLLEVPRELFVPVNLAEPFCVDEAFDLAVCLEVAEHLPAKAGRWLVRSLTAAAPLV